MHDIFQGEYFFRRNLNVCVGSILRGFEGVHKGGGFREVSTEGNPSYIVFVLR